MRFMLLLLLVGFQSVQAGMITGTVLDEKGKALPYASILVKETKQGTTANQQGVYSLQLSPGKYTISCQHVGYERKEQVVTVTADKLVLNFQLNLQTMLMPEVVVRQGGEDPAYEIIRNAIKKRAYYARQLENFQCEV